MAVDAEMLALFKAELELCRVHEGEVVAVLSAANERTDYAQAFMVAARSKWQRTVGGGNRRQSHSVRQRRRNPETGSGFQWSAADREQSPRSARLAVRLKANGTLLGRRFQAFRRNERPAQSGTVAFAGVHRGSDAERGVSVGASGACGALPRQVCRR